MTPEAARARVFVALPLAGEVQAEAVRVLEALRRAPDLATRLRWVHPDGLHVTLTRFPIAAGAAEPVTSCAPHERASAPSLHPH